MSLFSFINHPIESYIKSLSKLYPGISLAFGSYIDYNQKFKIISLKNKQFVFIDDKETIRNFIRFGKKLNTQNWLNLESLPVNEFSRNKELKQMKLEDEDKNSWLALKIKSNISPSYDFVLLRISNSNTFGINHILKNYNTTQKALISNLINNHFQYFINSSYTNYEALLLMNKSIGKLNNVISNFNNNNEISSKKHKEIFIQYINQIINSTANKVGLSISYNDDFINSIINSKFDISQIEKTIKQSIYICINSNINHQQKIELKPEHLIWPNNSISNQNVKHRDSSLVELLDRYEIAAQKAYNQGLKVIGNTVGECCNPSVTAASITFNIKKYEAKIYHLLATHKNQWPTLRNQFKPIKNVLNNHIDLNQKVKLA